MIFWGMIRGHDLGYDSGVWFAQIENHAFSKICTRSNKTQPNMSQLFLEDFALCCTGRSWLVSYLAQVSIYTLHTCRTMVEFGTIQQSRRSACHASCRHAKIGIISTQFGPRPLSKHVQALSWCPPAELRLQMLLPPSVHQRHPQAFDWTQMPLRTLQGRVKEYKSEPGQKLRLSGLPLLVLGCQGSSV